MPAATRNHNSRFTGRMEVVCVALNGYADRWAPCIQSQQRYCAMHEYHYRLIDEIANAVTGSPGDSKWLKLELLADSLHAGAGWVMVLDANALVMPGCPPMDSVEQAGKSVYLAMGRSGRFNSGVIIVRSSEDSRTLFRTILNDRHHRVAPQHFVSAEGENGHIIKHATGHPCVAEIPRRWNNTQLPGPDDYIRHFTGPMRQYYAAMMAAGPAG